ncbi:hypothetical protein [Sphingomonas sp. Leaf38]|uniref:hypothetical protein n=1 Tax=Sphingomonas sp. Leaf38 TaxID=1736217 RepID=UPI0006FD34B3|nr:hypothetical protein [Sphingomonas sp. Leaf38]KQN29214.1 hypothetical protein ASE88_09675 [Sphingomonas sp. Leaf38]
MTTRAGRRRVGPVGWTIGVLLLLALMLAYAPQVLAFPFSQRVGDVTVYAERPIDARIVDDLARAETLLRSSPIYTGPVHRSLFLTNGGWRWRVLAIQSPHAFAFRRPFGSAIVFNRSDIAADRVTTDRDVGNTRTLSGVIAHETTHIMIADHLGELRAATLPTWVVEGYADHVAAEGSLTDAEAGRLRGTDPGASALAYHDARRRVATVLAEHGGSVDALFAQR